MPRTVNDDYHRPAKQGPPPTPPPARTTQVPAQRNGGGHYTINGYPVYQAPAAANTADAKADRKASNDVRRGSASASAYVVPAGVGAQEKADGMLKQQLAGARNGAVVAAADGVRGVAHNNNYYYEPAHRDAANINYYYHHPATSTADHER